MAVPSYAGLQIFGIAPIFEHDDQPNAAQVNHYPGVRGVQRIDLGLASTTTHVTGLLIGSDDPNSVGGAFAALRSLKVAGGYATLIDTDGTAWPDAVLTQVRSVGQLDYYPGFGWGRRYMMNFMHLGFNPSGS